MKTMFKTIFQVLLMFTLPCGLAFGQAAELASAASNPATTTFTHVAPAPPLTTGFGNVITTHIKPPAGQSDLLVTFSAFATLLASSTNQDASTTAVVTSMTTENTAIRVRLVVDGNVVPFAGAVTIVPLDNLIKTTTLTIGPAATTDLLTQAFTLGGVRTVRWVVPDVGNGDHTVTVQAQFALSDVALPASTGQASSTAATLGPRVLTVEGVNIKND